MLGKKNGPAYSHFEAKALEGIPLPAKLKCDRCSRWLGQTNFSNRQLLDARFQVRKGGMSSTYRIKCNGCARGPGSLVEVECMMCRKTKGLEAFSKYQRTKADSAKCLSCVEDQVNLEAVQEDSYEDPRKAFEPLDHSNGTYPDFWAPSTTMSSASNASVSGFDDDDENGLNGGIALGMNRMSLGSGTSPSLIDTDEQSFRSSGGGGWSSVASKEKQSTSSKADSMPLFDPNKYGNPAARHPASLHSFDSTATEPSSKPGGWAKIKAYKPSEVQEPSYKPVWTRPSEFAGDDDWKSEGEESEDDDDDGDSDDSDTEI